MAGIMNHPHYADKDDKIAPIIQWLVDHDETEAADALRNWRASAALKRRTAEAEEMLATTIDEAMRTARNRDMWKGQCERQAATMTEMREALEPFARTEVWEHLNDVEPVTRANEVGIKIRAGDVRRAHRAFAKAGAL